MTSRWSHIAWYLVVTALLIGDISYRIVIQDLYDLAHARHPQNVWSLGGPAIIVLGCIGYFVATSLWPRRSAADRLAIRVTAVVVLVALFVFANAAPDGRIIPGGAFFVLEALFWNLAGTLALLCARDARSVEANVLRVYAVVLVAFQSVVGVIGASYAGDATMTYVAAGIAVAGTLATLALTLREWRLVRRETGAPSALRR